jgi:hypothetical protein
VSALLTQGGAFITTLAGVRLIAQPVPLPTFAPILSIEQLRVRVGLDPTDTSKDAAITSVALLALSLAERYCDRWFTFKAGQVEVAHPETAGALVLRRYPVEAIVSVTDQNGTALSPTSLWLDNEFGMVRGVGRTVFRGPLTVTYDGGYRETDMPPDLQLAIATLFDAVWAVTPGAGAGSGGGAVVVQGSGAMKSFSIPGVISVQYDVGATVAGGGSGTGAGSSDPWGIIPGVARSILDMYANHAPVGIG